MQEHVIAKKYAKALSSVCDSENINQVYDIYTKISEIFLISKFRDIVSSPIIDNTNKLTFIKSLVDITANSYAERLLVILVKNNRIQLLPFVTLEIKKIIDDKLNTYQATLYVKQELSESSLLNIQDKFGKKLNTTLKVTQSVEENLDGIKLEVVDLGIEVAFLKHKFTQDLQDFILKAI